MRIDSLSVATAVVAATLVAASPVSPATAGGPAHTISVAPTSARPGDTVTVTGTSGCASSAYTVTLTYTNPEGDNATVTANGTTDAEGAYTQPITVADTAVAGEPAGVQSTIPACGEGGSAATTGSTPLTITAHEGTLTVSPTSGPTGTQVKIDGTNCYGGEVVVAFTDGEDGFVLVEPVTLNPDRTFTATWAITDQAGPGQYFFVAECPGTDFDEVMFTVTARPGEDNTGGGGLPPAPPAVPVPGNANYTG